MPLLSLAAASREAICGEKYRESEACARSASSLTTACLAHHLDVTDGLVDGHFEIAEIDRLGKKIECAPVHRGADLLMSP